MATHVPTMSSRSSRLLDAGWRSLNWRRSRLCRGLKSWAHSCASTHHRRAQGAPTQTRLLVASSRMRTLRPGVSTVVMSRPRRHARLAGRAHATTLFEAIQAYRTFRFVEAWRPPGMRFADCGVTSEAAYENELRLAA